VLCHGIGDDDMAVLRSDTDAHGMRWLDALHPLVEDPSVALMGAATPTSGWCAFSTASP
jgi:hypothetical protein